MYSIQFCVCYYSILYGVQSHFTVNINKNSTQKDEIKMETSLDTIKNTNEAINLNNNNTVEKLAENVSKIHLGMDNRHKIVEKNKFIDIIDEVLLINLTLNDSRSTEKQQKVTGNMVEPADYLENKTASRINSKEIEGAKEFNITKNGTVEEQSTIVKNYITTEILQNKDNLPTISKNNVVMTKILQKHDNMANISQMNDKLNETFQKNNDTLKTAEENGFPKNIENKHITKISKDKDSPKNVRKRDIRMPGQAPNDYNPQDFQKQNTRKYRNYDIYKNKDNYKMPKNIQQYDPRNIAQKHEMATEINNMNDYKPYYQSYEIKYKNIIDKTDMLKKDEHIRYYDDSRKIIPQIQTRLNNDLVKKSFDEYKMLRRKTHYTMPDFDIQNDISKREIDQYQDMNYSPKFHNYYDEGYMNRPRNHVELNYYGNDIPNKIIYPSHQETNHIIYPVYEEVDPMPHNYKELNKILGRQKEIIQQLSKLQMDARKKNKPHDFDKLLSDVAKRQKWRNYTKFNFETTTKMTTTKLTTTAKPSTILTLFDETEVRLALKNDPNVKRILKMANLKREKYLKKVKKYMEKRNYTAQERSYTMTSPEETNTNSNEVIESTTIVM